MSELKARLRSDLTAAMKARDSVRKDTLRMLLSAVQKAEVAGSEARELSDADVVKVLAKESKTRLESAAVYDDAGRGELADAERAEERIIAEYLPQPLTDDEVAQLVAASIDEVRTETGQEPGMRQMGQVMKAATARAEGRADGARLSAAVKARLA